MALTRDFKKLFKNVHKDSEFRHGLLNEASNEFLAGDLKVSKELMRDYIEGRLQSWLIDIKSLRTCL